MLKKFMFKPGVNRENTRYTTEGGWYETEKARFRQGTPEKIGGWSRISANTFLGTCRSLGAWATLAGRKLIGVLTDRRSYIAYNGTYNNISAVIPGYFGTNYSTTAGSSIVRFDLVPSPNFEPNYNWVGSYVYFLDTSGIDANITAAVLNNNFFTITAFSYLNYIEIDVGVQAVATTTNQPLSGYIQYLEPLYSGYYSQSNWGQDLIFCQRGGHLCVWDGRYGFLLNGNTCTITVGASTTVTTTQACPPNSQRIPVRFASSGTLPTGLSVTSIYYLQPNNGASATTSFTLYTAATGGSVVSTSGTYTGTVFIRINATTIAGVSDPSANPADVPDKVNFTLVSDIFRFVFAFGTNLEGTTDSVGTATIQPMVIRWSDIEDYTNWTPTATSQAGSLVLSRGSEIVTAIQSRQEILVWTDVALFSLQYLTAEPYWGSQIVGDNISIVSQNAVAYANGVSYWMGKDKFYIYDGRTQTLNCTLRQYVFSDINAAQYAQVFASTNEGFNEIWWFYCSANSSTIDRYVIYNYLENIWYYGSLARTAWLDSGLFDYPIAATYSNNLVYHEYGVDDNTSGTPEPIAASITSSETDLDDGDALMFIRRVIPDLTFRGSTAGNPSGVLTLKPLKNSGSGYTVPASVGGDDNATVTRTATVPIEEYTGQVYIRIRARQIAMKWESTGLGVAWQLGAMRFDMKNDGRASGSGVSGG
jgi:hypothetical protein